MNEEKMLPAPEEGLRMVPDQWTSLIGLEDPAAQRSWSLYKPPAALSLLPQDQEISPKALEIVLWSLERASTTRSQQPAVARPSPFPHAAPEVFSSADDTRSAIQDRPLDAAEPAAGISSSRAKIIGRIKGRTIDKVSQSSKGPKTADPVMTSESLVECTSCFDDLPVSNLLRLPCTHYYCKKCLSTLVMTAAQTESSYPPKCCLSEVPPKLVVKVLDAKEMEIYKNKSTEAQQSAQARAEDEEMRVILLNIRRYEQHEAREREQRRQAEEEALRQEAEQLAVLEAERLVEEERRRRQERADAEQLRQALSLSVKLEADELRDTMMKIIHLQHVALDDKHGHAEQKLLSAFDAMKREQENKQTMLLPNKRLAAASRVESIRRRHEMEKKELAAQHKKQRAEHSSAISIQISRNPFRAAWAARQEGDLLMIQRVQTHDLEVKHNRALHLAQSSSERELGLIGRAIEKEMLRSKVDHDKRMGQLIAEASIERQWYLTVSERRLAMVAEHVRLMSEALFHGRDPVGLTVDRAANVRPIAALQKRELSLHTFHNSKPLSPGELSGFPWNSSPELQRSRGQAMSGDNKRAEHRSDPTALSERALNTHPNFSHPLTGPGQFSMPASLVSGRTQLPARQLTPPDPDEDILRNGTAFIAMKRGEPSSRKPHLELTEIPDVAMPPTPPDSPLLSPRITNVVQRKPLPTHVWGSSYALTGMSASSTNSVKPARQSGAPVHDSCKALSSSADIPFARAEADRAARKAQRGLFIQSRPTPLPDVGSLDPYPRGTATVGYLSVDDENDKLATGVTTPQGSQDSGDTVTENEGKRVRLRNLLKRQKEKL
ncbi:uncharacterized protein AB675_8742 [Cyphellophora attinorum]|uniref:RING-type domain-containing protein n=1 Tax=Cyphellophora attinorum TaxID=1664694 RepID=A0A0N0NR81_9EURO|nr:uncharacterized protein AB675_8742 [Phialophora attinorum]KPI44791.1 hypothetical protein AB675_8742 [Phialophora attinorum]